jgi:cobalamin-dependent methionine synthase I
MRRVEDGVEMGQAVRTYVYRTWLTEESRKSLEHVVHEAPHSTPEHTMSIAKRSAKKQAKAKHRRRLQAHERLQHDRRKAQQAAEALQQAVEDLGLPANLVAEIEGRLRSQQKLLGKIIGMMCPPLFRCRTNSELCRVRGWDKNLVRRESGK